MSLEQHSALIEQLKPLIAEPDFQELFDRLTEDESNSTRFLIKMELTRISAHCTRVIDLRDKTELPCEEVVIVKQRHFLDQPSKEVLLQVLPLYRNTYTLGVYEHVLKKHRERKQKLQENFNQEPAAPANAFIVPGVVLGSYFNRVEERMNYSIKIAVSQPQRDEVPGVTMDLSVGGARIKLPLKHGLTQDTLIKIKLLDLNEEFFVSDLQHGIEYQIVDIQNKDNNAVLRLKRISSGEELDAVLSKLINSYKFRYKVDVNDVIVTATGLGYERLYLPLLPHLPLYISIKDNLPCITHQLLGRGNQAINDYFLDEAEVSQLTNLITTKRLIHCIKSTDNTDHQYLFCFTHVGNGKTHFYSATLAELKASNSLQLFLGFASSKKSWRVFKITAQRIDHSQNYKTSTLPGDDAHYSALTEQSLAQFSHLVQLVDMTNDDVRLEYQRWYNKNDVNELKVFTQKKVTQNTIKKISLAFSERRHEARFAFKTVVVISQNGKETTGVTHDISSRGLQIVLDESIDFTSPAAVTLSFPRLQTVAGNINLSQLPYQLIRTRNDGKNLHLNALIGHEAHVGVEFLNKLIAHNKGKLVQISENDGQAKELADGMKNLMMRQLVSVPYFVEKAGKSPQVACLGIGIKADEISHLFSQNTDEVLKYNLQPLLDNGVLKQHIIDPVKAMNNSQMMEYFEVFIQLSRHAHGTIQLQCEPVDGFKNTAEKLQFIKKSKATGRFMALRVYYGATEKPDMSYIRREIEYIHIHANHRAKQLEEQLWKIISTGELLDITKEVELRYPELHLIPEKTVS